MDWTQQFDGYCERIDFTYWSEPVNAITNLAFIVAAIVMWRRGAGVPAARFLAYVTGAIGIGSYLFHTHATGWAALSDVVPIGIFILAYLFLINRDVWGWPVWVSVLGTAFYIPYAAVLVPIFDSLPFFHISDFYWTVPLLLFIYATAMRRRHPHTARGLALGGALQCLSMSLRSVDEIVCPAFPLGTHFLWHLINGFMLGYMIHVYLSHVLAARTAER